jgi:signal transduction histidine kinase/ligand-binding sensor domain-containing protein/AraC-like DNA-binding protein
MKKIIFFLFHFLFGFSFLFESAGRDFFSTNDAISSSLINLIYQDSRNYIWVATEDGLNKYDGVRFSIYKNNPNDTTTIKNNYVKSLFEDRSGKFWVGSLSGLQIYNRDTDNFSEVPLYSNGALITPHVTRVIESADGEIWITTSEQGVIRFNKDKGVYQTDHRISSRLSSMYLTYIFQDSKGIFWIASENQGLNRYNPETDEVTIFKMPGQIGSNQISTICENAEGAIFVGTLTNGLYKYNAVTRVFELVPYGSHSALPIKSLLIDNKSRLLVGTDGRGIKIYNEKKRYLEDFQLFSAPFDFSRMKVHTIIQDKMGNIWTGLFQKGVFIIPEISNQFEYWGYKSFSHNIIGSGCVMSLWQDTKNVLWVGTDNDGIYRLENGHSLHLTPLGGKHSVPLTVMNILDDDSGNLWLGSYLSGLAYMDKQTGRCTYLDDRINALNENSVLSLAKDRHNRLWIGTNGTGVYLFDLEKKKYIDHYSQSQTAERKINNNWINSLFYGTDDLLWIGSFNGVYNINTENGKVTTYPNSILPGNVVFSINEDSKGNIWIGTTEGLACFDKKSGKSKIYTVADGMPSNIVCGILEDEEGNIWLSTYFGISKLIVGEERFISYFELDGLQGNEFTRGAAFKAQDGKMFFGGTGGITAFYPSRIKERNTPLNVYLTRFYIFEKPVVAGHQSGRNVAFDRFISDVDTIRLNHKDNMFSFEFSTFDFGSTPRVFYKYKMEGLNSIWINTEPGVNRINFTNMSHGTYKLHVKASIDNYSSEEKTITIIITPPWYRSWWAYLIYFALFALLIWGIARFILDRVRHKNELLRREHAEQVNESKLQFFINISHEIRTPMTLIISPLEKLIAESKDGEKLKVYSLMYRNAKRILQLINQLLDVRKIDKGLMTVKFRETDIVEFLCDFMRTFEYQAEKRKIHFSFVHTDPQLNVWIDPNNFDKVVMNILSNAFKFTPDGGEITVTLQHGTDKDRTDALSDFFEIIISDTGKGIKEEEIEKIFERFYQVNAGDAHLSVGGTGIGLHLSRSLIKLQHGILYARNRSDVQGSEFIIRLPMGNAHLSKDEIDTGDDSRQEMPVRKQTEIKPENLEIKQEESKKVKPKTKYRVLLVDDEDEIRQYLHRELANTYKISEAINGKTALEKILKEKPDLVISDVMMPEMDGITLCRKLKSNVNINHIPVVLLTAKASDKDKTEGFSIGADAYISKPFNIDLLKGIVGSIIENRVRLRQKTSDAEENKSLIEPIVLRSSDQVLYEKVIKIINENIANPDLNVEMLASNVGMSRVHMHRKLKELTGQSARDFIRSIRLKQAADLLAGNKLSVSEVMYALGFTNLSHFSNSFKEFYGMSPKEYAEKNREKIR